MINISVLILAKNEENNIEACINSVRKCSEIIVIDDFSSDKTKLIAESMGAKVIQRSLAGDWGGQQTFAIQQAKFDWIFFIDADERATDELITEIGEVVNKNEKYAYWIQRRNKFHFNKATHGILRPDFVCRVMPKEGSYVEGLVHPTVIAPYLNKKLKSFMCHYTYDNWNQYFNKFNNYTNLAAAKYKAEGKRSGFVKDILLRPTWAFIKIYIIQGGFLDGKLGWILSVNHYFYTMSKYVKLYYLNKSGGKL